MGRSDFRTHRLFVEEPLADGADVGVGADAANYLFNVLRQDLGNVVLVFNGRDGEWEAEVTDRGKRGGRLSCRRQTRPQTCGPDIDYLFAPLKRSRLDYMVQKATEMGAARLRPVLTRYTVPERVNAERMRANVIEAAEQCGILRVPEVHEPEDLARVLAAWDEDRRLVFCDEAEEGAEPAAVLPALRGGKLAVLIGPEGGFAEEERTLIRSLSYAVPLSLGPRILRADTAAVAALAVVNALAGDWRSEA